MTTAAARTCIALICDMNYLLYTLVSAQQAKTHAPQEIDTIIFLDADSGQCDLAARISERVGLSIRLVPPALRSDIAAIKPHTTHFSHTHLSQSALLRLKIADLTGDIYDRVLYLDGDTLIRKSLKPLFDTPQPEGKFLAVRDWKAHQSHEGMPEHDQERVKLTALFLPEAKWGGYFNTGVLLGDKKAWREIGPLALEFYKQNPNVCEFYDQCALNAVASDRVQHISVYWNFLRFYMALPAYKKIDPAILHFATTPKPWNGPMRPWGPEGYAPYARMHALLNDFDLAWRKLPAWRQLKWNLREVLKPTFRTREYRDQMQRYVLQDGAG